MKLYYAPLSTFSQRVRIALDEKGLKADLVAVDMPGREHKSEAYLTTKNPYGRVPVIDDDGFVLFESTAILQYLEDKHPSPPLLPSDIKLRALAHQYMKTCDLDVGAQTGTLIRPTRFVPRENWRLEEMQKARDAIVQHFKIVDGQLRGEWMVGDAFSLVEVCYAPFVRFLDELAVDVTPKVRAWAGRILARESVRRNWLER